MNEEEATPADESRLTKLRDWAVGEPEEWPEPLRDANDNLLPPTSSTNEPVHLRRLRRLTDWAEGFSIVIGILGVIGGGILAAHPVDESYGLYSTTSTHPFIGLGLAAIFGSVVTAVFMWMITLWAKAWGAEAQNQWDERSAAH